MFTLKLFEGLLKVRSSRMSDRDLATWARIEYKNDAEFAYNHMKETGVAPTMSNMP